MAALLTGRGCLPLPVGAGMATSYGTRSLVETVDYVPSSWTGLVLDAYSRKLGFCCTETGFLFMGV